MSVVSKFNSAKDHVPFRSEVSGKKLDGTMVTIKNSQIHSIDEKTGTLPELVNSCPRSTALSTARERKKRITMQHISKIFQFSDEMGKCHERRLVLNKQRSDFEERRINFHQFIMDNVAKMRRQQFAYKENARLQALGKTELENISKATEEALNRRAELQTKLSRLQIYEKFVSDTIKLLPKNYIRSNRNAADSLMARFAVLYQMKSLLLSELYEKQESIERESRQLLATRLCSTEEILTKSSELQETGNEWRRVKERVQQSMELYERDKDRTTEECIRFFTVIRALRNIAEKSALGLASLQTHPIGTQHKAALQMNFRLILKFLQLATSIRDEIAPPSRRQRGNAGTETIKSNTVSSVGYSHPIARSTALNEAGPRDESLLRANQNKSLSTMTH